ncbi:hypothetical protein RIF29_16021 [Crotalaria pallida]|uniref:Pentatricopeptide repeat protein n=1 Tax=Crotalaria pallida TaxID=3830 RepID=A0AAN9FK73_CROPI
MKHLKQAHALVFTTGLENNTFALSRVLAFCSNPHKGSLTYACKVFDHIPHPTICICNTIFKAFILNGKFTSTIHVFTKVVVQNGLSPDNYTIPYVLKSCAALQSCSLGKMVHGYSSKSGLGFDIFVGNSLMAMYSVCGDMVGARQVFDEIPSLSVVSWTVMISGYARRGDVDLARFFFDEAPEKDRGVWGAMISGYVQNNCFKEGLYLFHLMQLTDIVLDESIFVSILSACAHMGALDIGIWIHRCLNQARLPLSIRLSTSLLDMYAKCGQLKLAKTLFDLMPKRDIVCWNAMISGMAMHGNGTSALELFTDMEKAGIEPDDITFIAVFTACSYSGMAYEAQLAELAAERLLQLENHSGVYVLLSNLYTASGKHSDARWVRDMMKSKGADKAPGCSSVEIDGVLSEFIAGEKVHPQLEEIHLVLKKMHMQLDLNTPITRQKV